MSTSFALATRFARGARRRDRVLNLIAVLGIALGVAVVLGGMSVDPALQARDARQARHFTLNGERGEEVLLVDRTFSTFRDQDLRVLRVAPIGDAPIPPGLNDIPDAGEIAASPALARILDGPDRHLLDVRVPGVLTATIAEDGLVEPEELTAYVGVDPEQLSPRSDRVKAFHHVNASLERYELDAGVRAAIAAAVAAVILAVSVFIWTVTRLGAAGREVRLAALRLLGVSPAKIRWIVALEVGISAAFGSCVGLVLFLLGRRLVPWELLLPEGVGLFPSDLRPPMSVALVVLGVVPLLAVGVAWVSLRRVVAEPIAVARRARARSTGVILGALALAGGLAAWIVSWLAAGWLHGVGGNVEVGVRLLAWVLTPLGVLGVAPWFGTTVAAALMRVGTGGWLAARRLQHDRRTSSRIVAGVVSVIYGATVSIGMLQLFVLDQRLLTPANLDVDAIVVYLGPAPSLPATAVDGATARVPVALANATVDGTRRTVDVFVADCSALSAVLREVPACAPVMRSAPGSRLGGAAITLLDIHGEAVMSLNVPEDGPTLDLGFTHADLFLDSSSIPASAASTLATEIVLLATTGAPDVAESVRESLGPRSRATVVETSAFRTFGWSHEGSIARALQWTAYLTLAVAAATMLVAVTGTVHERRRPIATLAAAGVPTSSLRASFVLQTVAPLIPAIALALACGFVAVAVNAAESFDGADLGSAMAPGLRLAAIALVGGIVASLLALPTIGRSIDPAALHTE